MLGYIPDPSDDRDWQWTALYGAPVVPSRVNLESLFGPAYDQGQTFTCVAQVVAALKRLHEFAETGRWLTFDADELYSICKGRDGRPHDNGTIPRIALDVAVTDGMLASDGARYKIAGYARLGSSDEIRTAIGTGFPVLIGVPVDVESLAKYRSGELLPPVPAGHATGHAMLAVGYDDQVGGFRIRNSWGPTWGDYGHLWMPYDYLTVTDRYDAWTCVDAKEGAAQA